MRFGRAQINLVADVLGKCEPVSDSERIYHARLVTAFAKAIEEINPGFKHDMFRRVIANTAIDDTVNGR